MTIEELKNICDKLLCVTICRYYDYHVKTNYKNDNGDDCLYFNNYNMPEESVLIYNSYVIRYADIKKLYTNKDNEITIIYNDNGNECNMTFEPVYRS